MGQLIVQSLCIPPLRKWKRNLLPWVVNVNFLREKGGIDAFGTWVQEAETWASAGQPCGPRLANASMWRWDWRGQSATIIFHLDYRISSEDAGGRGLLVTCQRI
jgi:hypothetical protein